MADKKIRPIRVEGNVAYVPLSKGYEAVIDAADAHLVQSFNWTANVNRHSVYGYCVVPGGSQKNIRLHRLIMAAPDGVMVDHVDGDGLNNRRSNLRLASHSENGRNSRTPATNVSGFKGVSWDRSRCKWQAHIRVNGKSKNLGRFDSAELAHAAYAQAASRFFGQFARSD